MRTAATVETDPVKIQSRLKQIQFGKNTIGYDNYTAAVPRKKRYLNINEHPRTPDPYEIQSKRAFDGKIKVWRRGLHKWDSRGEAAALLGGGGGGGGGAGAAGGGGTSSSALDNIVAQSKKRLEATTKDYVAAAAAEAAADAGGGGSGGGGNVGADGDEDAVGDGTDAAAAGVRKPMEVDVDPACRVDQEDGEEEEEEEEDDDVL